jgi:type II secretory pathway pseudopilin PulG
MTPTHEPATLSGEIRPRAFTLVEAAISIVIVGVMLVASLSTLGAAARSGRARMEASQHQALALDLMGEVLQAHYEESTSAGDQTFVQNLANTIDVIEPAEHPAPTFGPEPGEADGTRIYFDDVDDYKDWQSAPPQAKDGTPLPNLDGWERRVRVHKVQVNDPTTETGGPDEGLKRIKVRVIGPDGKRTGLVALRSRTGTYDQVPNVESTYVTWAGVKLQIGEATPPISSGTHLLNGVVAQE